MRPCSTCGNEISGALARNKFGKVWRDARESQQFHQSCVSEQFSIFRRSGDDPMRARNQAPEAVRSCGEEGKSQRPSGALWQKQKLKHHKLNVKVWVMHLDDLQLSACSQSSVSFKFKCANINGKCRNSSRWLQLMAVAFVSVLVCSLGQAVAFLVVPSRCCTATSAQNSMRNRIVQAI